MNILDNLFKKESLPTIIFNDSETERQTHLFLDVNENLTKDCFGLILTCIGFNNDDTIVLWGFTTNNMQMLYKVMSKDNQVTDEGKFEIVLWYDFDHGMTTKRHSISVINNNERKNYEYDFNAISTIAMISHTINDPETGLSFTREFERDEYTYTIENFEYKFSFNVKKKVLPFTGTYSRSMKMEPYILNNESKLEEYLQSLDFKVDIVEVYKKVCELSLNNIDDYSEIDIKVEKKLDKNALFVTDELILQGSKKAELTLTIGNKTITADKEDNYTYSDPKISAKRIQGQYTHLTFKIPSTKYLNQFASPNEILDNVEKDVLETKNVLMKL